MKPSERIEQIEQELGCGRYHAVCAYLDEQAVAHPVAGVVDSPRRYAHQGVIIGPNRLEKAELHPDQVPQEFMRVETRRIRSKLEAPASPPSGNRKAVVSEFESRVEAWHTGDSTLPLHEFLGLTWEQYSQMLSGKPVLVAEPTSSPGEDKPALPACTCDPEDVGPTMCFLDCPRRTAKERQNPPLATMPRGCDDTWGLPASAWQKRAVEALSWFDEAQAELTAIRGLCASAICTDPGPESTDRTLAMVEELRQRSVCTESHAQRVCECNHTQDLTMPHERLCPFREGPALTPCARCLAPHEAHDGIGGDACGRCLALDEAQAKLTRLKADNAQLQGKLDEVVVERDRLKEELGSAQNNVADYADLVKALKEESARLSGELSARQEQRAKAYDGRERLARAAGAFDDAVDFQQFAAWARDGQLVSRIHGSGAKSLFGTASNGLTHFYGDALDDADALADLAASLAGQSGVHRYRSKYHAARREVRRLNRDLAMQSLRRQQLYTRLARSHDREAEQRAEAERTSRQPVAPRLPVGPFRPELTARPILLQVDDAALEQIRDLIASLGNWYDFAAFNNVVGALSALDRTEPEEPKP